MPQSSHHLVEIYLPLTSNDGQPYGRQVFERIRDELAERFGGVTFFSRSPAEGVWKNAPDGERSRDAIVIAEVLVEQLNPPWWRGYRQRLEKSLGQEEVLIRAHAVTKL